MKKDGTENHFFALANENTVLDLNIPKYLNSLECTKLNIREVKLFNGTTLQMLNFNPKNDIVQGLAVRFVDNSYQKGNLPNGRYLSSNLSATFIISNDRIKGFIDNRKIMLPKGDTLVIEASEGESSINKPVSVNGKPLHDQRIKTKGRVYDIVDNRILNIYYVYKYELTKGWEIVIEQQNQNYFSKGDRIIDSKPVNPIPDGKYRRKGYLERIKIADMKVV